MTDTTGTDPGRPIGSWRATYTPGDWVVLSGPTSMIVLAPAPGKASQLINDMWVDVVRADSIDNLVHRLAAYNVQALPTFAVFFWGRGGLRSLVRGSIKVMDLSTGNYVADGEGVQTWNEVGLGALRQVRVDMDEVDPDGLQLPLVVGAVTASAVVLDATDAAVVSSPQPLAGAASTSAGTSTGAPAVAATAAPVVALASGSVSEDDEDFGGSVIVADAAALAAAKPIGRPSDDQAAATEPSRAVTEPASAQSADDAERAEVARGAGESADDSPDEASVPAVTPVGEQGLSGVDLTSAGDDAVAGDEPGDEFDAHPALPVAPAASASGQASASGAASAASAAPAPPGWRAGAAPAGPVGPGAPAWSGGPQGYGPGPQPGPPQTPPPGYPQAQPNQPGPPGQPSYGQQGNPQQGNPNQPGRYGAPPQPPNQTNQPWGRPPQQQGPPPGWPPPGQPGPPAQQGGAQAFGPPGPWGAGPYPPGEQPGQQQPGPGGFGPPPPPQNQPSASRPPTPPAPPAPPTPTASPEEDVDHDGATVFATSLARAHKVADGGQSGGEGLVLADLCVVQHPNPPGSSRCRICGGSIPQQGSRLVTRPVLAVLRPSQGAAVNVDRPVLIGRSPSADRVAHDQLPRLLTVPSPSHDISRTHVRVTPDGWDLAAMDEYSTNGTILVRPGAEPERERLTPGEAIPVFLGNVLDLGDGITITIEIPS